MHSRNLFSKLYTQTNHILHRTSCKEVDEIIATNTSVWVKRYTWGYLQSKEPSQIPVLKDTVYDMFGSIYSYLGSLTVAINSTDTLFRDCKGPLASY